MVVLYYLLLGSVLEPTVSLYRDWTDRNLTGFLDCNILVPIPLARPALTNHDTYANICLMTETKNRAENQDHFGDDVVRLSDEEVQINVMPDGKRVAIQKVDSIDLSQLNSMIGPGKKVPHEVAFRVGQAQHRLFYSYERQGTWKKERDEAALLGIPTVVRGEVDPEDYPWVHTQYTDKGKLVGIEEIDEYALSDFHISEGHPLADNQPPVRDLHVAYYEGQDWAEPTGLKSPQHPMQKAWSEAYGRMCDVAGEDELCTAIDISLREDPDQIAGFLDKQEAHLTPETVFFLKTSEAIKRARTNQKE